MAAKPGPMLINAYATHRHPPALAFPHKLRSRRDRSDPELAKHLDGFMGFVTQRGTRPMNASRYAVLQHLGRVQHHLALEVNPADMDAFSAWAHAANALVFLPDSAVRAPDGRILVAPDTGDAEPDARMPFPIDAQVRKAGNEKQLAAKGVPVLASLPPVIAEVEVELRTTAEVTARTLALFACAIRAETLASGDPLPTSEIRERLPSAVEAMSPQERAFFELSKPTDQQVMNFTWRYEALSTLLWALGRLESLPFATNICDVPAAAKAMLAHKPDVLIASAKLRPTAVLLDALDLHFRLHWATTDARANHKPMPAGLNDGVIFERHLALNWLTRFGDADWDDVDTPT